MDKPTEINRYGDISGPTFYRVSSVVKNAEEHGAIVEVYGDDVKVIFTPELLNEYLRSLGVEMWKL